MISQLLQTTFYISDSSANRKRTYYFRHDDWLLTTEPLLSQLSDSIFEKAEEDLVGSSAQLLVYMLIIYQILTDKTLQPSFVRLMPKETGVRPIVNLRNQCWIPEERFGQIVGYKRGRSINNILRSAFDVLTYERLRQPNAMGASLLGSHEAFEKLKEYKLRLIGHPNERKWVSHV